MCRPNPQHTRCKRSILRYIFMDCKSDQGHILYTRLGIAGRAVLQAMEVLWAYYLLAGFEFSASRMPSMLCT